MQAMGPLIGTVVDPAALARYVLQNAFAVKDPDKFILQQQPPPGAPAEGEGAPQGLPGGVPMAGPQGPPVPPELMKQLQNQMGLNFRPQVGNQ